MIQTYNETTKDNELHIELRAYLDNGWQIGDAYKIPLQNLTPEAFQIEKRNVVAKLYESFNKPQTVGTVPPTADNSRAISLPCECTVPEKSNTEPNYCMNCNRPLEMVVQKKKGRYIDMQYIREAAAKIKQAGDEKTVIKELIDLCINRDAIKEIPNTSNMDYAKAVSDFLPAEYKCEHTAGGVHCKSETGITSEEKWALIVQNMKKYFGDHFQEIHHQVNSDHKEFTVYLK